MQSSSMIFWLQGILLVYDITSKWSFGGIDRWIKEIDEVGARAIRRFVALDFISKPPQTFRENKYIGGDLSWFFLDLLCLEVLSHSG